MKRFPSLLLLLALNIPLHAQSIVQVIPLPNVGFWNYAYGLAADTSKLYMTSEWSTSSTYNYGYIYTLNRSGVVVDSVNPNYGYSQGLAYDGTNFYYVRRYTATCTLVKMTRTGTIIDSLRFGSPTRFIGGAVWDGTSLWVSDYSSTTNPTYLYKINWATKTIVDSIRTIGLQPTGLAWDGQYLYYAMDLNGSEPNQSLIYVVNPATHDTVRTIPMPESPSTDCNPRGLAWDGHYLWLLAEPVGASSGRSLYKYDLGGTGTADINLSRDSVDLGYRRMGGSYMDSIAVQNVGTAPLRIDSLNGPLGLLTGHFSSSFPITLQPGSSAKFYIVFQPAAFASYTSTFFIYSNDPDEAVKTFSAKGFGIYPTARIKVDTVYDFGSRRVGSSSSWLMAVQNVGGPQLAISSMTVGGSTLRIDSIVFPVGVDSLQSKSFRVWFSPTGATTSVETLKVTSNASNGPVTRIVLRGTGDATPIPIGQPFWTFTVPDNPRSSTTKLTKGVRAISDITGDGKPDVVVCSENYWTMALNGNASGTTDSIWAFNTFISSFSAGSIGSTGDYSTQKALATADLNMDGYKDVIIGTGGGNEHVYALNGRNGSILWQFGTDAPDSFSLGDMTGVDVSTDYTGDGIPDVIAAGSATESGGTGGRRSVFLFNGANGNIRWVSPLPGFTHAVTAIGDISGDGVPDVIGCVGEPSYKASAYSGANGTLLWDFPVTSASGGAKEVLPWPVQNQTPDVIMSAFWGPVYRIDGESGTQVWTRPTGGSGVMQLIRLKDVTGDGVNEILAPLLGGGIYCINGANGNIVWSLPTGNTMGATAIPDLNQDGFDDVAIAVQNQGTMFVKGQDGSQLALYATGSSQSREVAAVPDIDGNNSYEVIFGGKDGNIALLSGGVNAGPTAVAPAPGLPEKIELGQNYPNPFNPSTTIKISLPVQSDFSFKIYDILGKEVRAFSFERVPAGTHQITWDGKNQSGSQVSSGVYLYRLSSGSTLVTKQMILLR